MMDSIMHSPSSPTELETPGTSALTSEPRMLSPEQILPVRSFRTLTVGDLQQDVRIFEYLWTPIVLKVGKHAWNVEEVFLKGEHYLRCVLPYKNREFEKLWGFSCCCENYMHHKIIVLKGYTGSISWDLD